jgi:hypothetical protein
MDPRGRVVAVSGGAGAKAAIPKWVPQIQQQQGVSRTLTRVQTAVKQGAHIICPRVSGDDNGRPGSDEVRPATSCYCRGVLGCRMGSRPNRFPPRYWRASLCL